MQDIMFFIIYLIGSYCSYIFTKINLTRDMQISIWTKSHRNMALFFGFLSWLGIIANCIIWIVSVKNDSPSKW